MGAGGDGGVEAALVADEEEIVADELGGDPVFIEVGEGSEVDRFEGAGEGARGGGGAEQEPG